MSKPLPAPPSHPPHARVAIVEDDADVRGALEFMLETDGFEVATYCSGAEFLATADFGDTGFLVADYQMPGMTGIELLAALKERGVTIPALVITGAPNAEMLRRAHALGAIAVLEKPLSDDMLSRTIRTAMDGSGARGRTRH